MSGTLIPSMQAWLAFLIAFLACMASPTKAFMTEAERRAHNNFKKFSHSLYPHANSRLGLGHPSSRSGAWHEAHFHNARGQSMHQHHPGKKKASMSQRHSRREPARRSLRAHGRR
mmetsp:Transcript_26629/g.62154  ORF Transcript_26629/g.62154 Transcript_26629/m.62154 type:complete len:115 (+) Transcript_26629:119-463(+)